MFPYRFAHKNLRSFLLNFQQFPDFFQLQYELFFLSFSQSKHPTWQTQFLNNENHIKYRTWKFKLINEALRNCNIQNRGVGRKPSFGLFWIAGKREVYFKTREQVRLWAYYRCNYIYMCIYIYIYILEAVIASTIYSSTSLYSIGLANRGPVPSLFGQRPRTPRRHCEMQRVCRCHGSWRIGRFSASQNLENSVPLHPMVLLIIIPTKWLFHLGVYPIFRHTQDAWIMVRSEGINPRTVYLWFLFGMLQIAHMGKPW